MKKIILFSALTLVLFATDMRYNRGEMLYFEKGCNGCHGSEAEGGGVYPKLANKTAKYLKARLQHFQKDKLSSVSEEMMAQFVRTLKEEEIEDLVYFLTNHKTREIEPLADELLGGYGS